MLLPGVLVLLTTLSWWYRGREHSTVDSAHLDELVRPGDAAGLNLILVTLDTTRWDRLGCYGCEEAQTPNFDLLAENGIRFDQAIASAPLTLPSHTTILTGLEPPRHGARDNGRYHVDPGVETLAESFQAAGYRTAAFVSCFVLDQRYGLAQGFDTYDFQIGEGRYRPQMVDFNERSATEVTQAAIHWLEEGVQGDSRPYFLWVHYFDPHLPYQSPLQQRPEFAGRGYDAEIAYADQEFGRLLDALDRLQQRERTVIVLTADHGESLGEHEEDTHGMFIYDATVRVPLIVSNPRLFARGSVETGRLAGLVDVAPTLRALFGLPSIESDGLDLTASRAAEDRTLYLETMSPLHVAGWSPLFGLRTMRAKYIRAPGPEFYDLERDPRELTNAWASRHDDAARMEQSLAALQAEWDDTPLQAVELDDETRERLASLGYISLKNEGENATLADPKSMMGLFNLGARAESYYATGRYREAAAAAESVLTDCDACVSAIRVLAFARMRLGDPDAAIELLREESQKLGDRFLFRSLAQVLILNERFDEATSVLDDYARIAPRDGRTLIMRGDILSIQGDRGSARRAYEEARSLDPKRVGPMAAERIGRLDTPAEG